MFNKGNFQQIEHEASQLKLQKSFDIFKSARLNLNANESREETFRS